MLNLRKLSIFFCILASVVASADWRANQSFDGTFATKKVVIDHEGNTVLAGNRANPSRITVMKLDPNGQTVWLKTFQPASTCGISDLTVNSKNDLILAVSTFDSVDTGWQTVAYDKDGSRLWGQRFAGMPSPYFNAPSTMCVDSHDNVYVSGLTLQADGLNTTTVKYGPGGNLRWQASTPGYAPREIIANTSGRVTVLTRTVDGADLKVVQYTHFGDLAWTSTYSSPVGGQDFPAAMRKDGDGNFVVGYHTGINVKYYGVHKINGETGAEMWTTEWSAHSANGGVIGVLIGSDNSIFINGNFADRGVEISRLGSDGALLWSKRYATTTQTAPMAILADGKLYVPLVNNGVSVLVRRLDLNGGSPSDTSYPGSGVPSYYYDSAADDAGTMLVVGGVFLPATGPSKGYVIFKSVP